MAAFRGVVVNGIRYHCHVTRKNNVRFKWQLKSFDHIVLQEDGELCEGTATTKTAALNKGTEELKRLREKYNYA